MYIIKYIFTSRGHLKLFTLNDTRKFENLIPGF